MSHSLLKTKYVLLKLKHIYNTCHCHFLKQFYTSYKWKQIKDYLGINDTRNIIAKMYLSGWND